MKIQLMSDEEFAIVAESGDSLGKVRERLRTKANDILHEILDRRDKEIAALHLQVSAIPGKDARIAEMGVQVARLLDQRRRMLEARADAQDRVMGTMIAETKAEIEKHDATIRQMAANECRLKRALRALHDLFDALLEARPLSEEEEKRKYLNDMAING